MSARRPYVRPMDGWWRRNPYFVEYMVHEATALFVALYALVLLFGLWRLAQGAAAWNAWVEWLRSGPAVVLHVIVLAAFLYHTWTWFHIMPRTLPPVIVGGKRIPGATITRAGLGAFLLASFAVLALILGAAS